ncbi:MAG: AbrB/MazE/SpoVT family DNA-binding domain-containing protein [Candidatus Bathyarchaeia archaeon]
MIRRRVQRVGKVTMYVTLPKHLAEAVGIHHGSYVEFDIIKDGEAAIIIRPVKQAAGEVEGR